MILQKFIDLKINHDNLTMLQKSAELRIVEYLAKISN